MSVTFAAPATRPRRTSHVADAVLAAAVELARAAAVETAGKGEVGDHLGARAEDQRLVTHYFASTARGYVGWQWAVTLARPPRARTGTVCEVALLPGDGAIVAPAWLPWSERLQPGDIGRDDVLPFIEDDPRLEPGYEETGDDDADRLAIDELGLGRVRVISPLGRDEAATRWYEGDRGPITRPGRTTSGSGARRSRPPVAALAPQCATCGFFLLMAGSLRTMFGVCSNAWSPDDGRVVSLDHGCGAHSESDVERLTSDWPAPAPIVDDHDLEIVGGAEGVNAATVPLLDEPAAAPVDEVEVPVDEAEVPVDEAEHAEAAVVPVDEVEVRVDDDDEAPSDVAPEPADDATPTQDAAPPVTEVPDGE